ncbi:MAG TPA: hypothetical protein VEF76_08155 [Patescibacteria group bacterium]|nr:hypothetical protein [Patescibacteria group bacterium]
MSDTRSKFFDGTVLADPFETLLALDWRKDEFAIAGSASLYMLSTTALNRGFDGLIARKPQDLDILVVGEARERARELGIITDSNLARGYLISLQLKQNKGDLLDVTTCWPVGPEVQTARELEGITHGVDGLRVMEEQWVLELKDKFNRAKDRPDIDQAKNVLFRNRKTNAPSGLLPKIPGLP